MDNNHILRIIKLNLPAMTVKMGGELGAMLGQYNLNIIKFCNEFNEVSKIYEKNLLIQTNLLVLPGNVFLIKLNLKTTSNIGVKTIIGQHLLNL